VKQRYILGILVGPISLTYALVPSAYSSEPILVGDSRIVGGTSTTIKANPWLIAIKVDHDHQSNLCSGSLIYSRWIVTAAHCFDHKSSQITIGVKYSVDNYQTEGTWIKPKSVHIHSGYVQRALTNDIALLELDADISASVIPMAAETLVLSNLEPLTVTGWGSHSEGGEVSTSLSRATVPYVPTSRCNEPLSYDNRILPSMLCAGRAGGGIDACQGDSGGPLIRGDRPGNALLIGIVSFGDGCARKDKFGVYTRLSSYREWIKAQMESPQ
jgi:trypsin